MKTLILNSSPHKNGDTAYKVNEIKKKLIGDIEEIFLYDAKISPLDIVGKTKDVLLKMIWRKYIKTIMIH